MTRLSAYTPLLRPVIRVELPVEKSELAFTTVAQAGVSEPVIVVPTPAAEVTEFLRSTRGLAMSARNVPVVDVVDVHVR